MSHNIYEPLITKAEEWIFYDDNKPEGDYWDHIVEHDEYRRWHDRDCVLTGGNLNADTLFSLWTPLKQTILRLNSTNEIELVGNINSKYSFLRELIKGDNLAKLLPADKIIVSKLADLFQLGMGRENVFLLPNRELNVARAQRPYRDYVPYFLLETFKGGAFAEYWTSPEEHLQWIKDEYFEVFFEGEVLPANLKDLSCSGDIHISFAPKSIEAMERMIDNYIYILQERRKCFSREEINNSIERENFMKMDNRIEKFRHQLQEGVPEAVEAEHIILGRW